MHTNDGMLDAVRHFGDGEGGSIGGENGLRLADGVQFGKEFFLGRHILFDALNDEIGVSGGGLLFHQNVIHDGVFRFLGHFAPAHELVKTGGELVLVALRGLDGACVHQGGVTVLREDLRDAASHGTRAKNCYLHVFSSS